MVADGQMEVLLRQGVFRPSEEASHTESVVSTTVKIHEVTGLHRAENPAIVERVGLQFHCRTGGFKMLVCGQKLLDSGSEVTSVTGREAKKGVQVSAAGDLFAHGEKFVAAQPLQTDGKVSVADAQMRLFLLKIYDSVGKMFEGKWVLYDHNRSLVRSRETSFDTEVSLSRKQSLETV